MRKSKLMAMFLVCVFLAVSTEAKEKPVKYVKSKDGLNTLIQLSKDKNLMAKQLEKETSNYENIKKAIGAGTLTVGLSTEEIKAKYGEPVVILEENGDAAAKWVYKAGPENYFTGGKVYLFFDAGGKLLSFREIAPRAK